LREVEDSCFWNYSSASICLPLSVAILDKSCFSETRVETLRFGEELHHRKSLISLSLWSHSGDLGRSMSIKESVVIKLKKGVSRICYSNQSQILVLWNLWQNLVPMRRNSIR
jgi:hypothetical protein